jgi:hypothetical protein
MRSSRIVLHPNNNRRSNSNYFSTAQTREWILCALASLIFFWCVCFVVLFRAELQHFNDAIHNNKNHQPYGDVKESSAASDNEVQQQQQHPEQVMEPQLLSRNAKRVKVTTDVRGNLGPPEVLIQNPPGRDWIKDRWQAASNMHGKAIPGHHWVMLEFDEPIVVSKIVLDWEAAYANLYVIKGSLEEITTENLFSGGNVYTLFDSRVTDEGRHVAEFGKSPGVKTKTPLHVVHTIDELNHNWPIKYLRIGILKSEMGWGVSLWQVDVYGQYESKINQ